MDIKEKIIKILLGHPEGLTFTQIAKEIGMHRTNIVKYVYEMKGNKIILIRNLKTLKLCYLRKHFKAIE
jgi:DNA-binding Lrp family transcriptional regulator